MLEGKFLLNFINSHSYNVDEPNFNFGNSFKICSWNINGIQNKLSLDSCSTLIKNQDIIFISETKTNLNITVPGFVVYQNNNGNDNSAHRGGICVLIKNYLQNDIKSIDTNEPDQIWVEFHSYPHIIFGGIYIPPVDSQYFNLSSFAYIQSKIFSQRHKSFIISGDFNGRFGISNFSVLNELLKELKMNHSYYIDMVDPILRPNHHGKALINLIKDNNIIPLNGLKISNIQCDRKLTFKMKTRWVSEIDMCLISPELTPFIKSFEINHNHILPSNHAPIFCELVVPFHSRITSKDIAVNASQLFNYDYLNTKTSSFKKKLDSNHIDLHKLHHSFCSMSPPLINNVTNINTLIETTTDQIYSLCANNKIPRNNTSQQNSVPLNRWQNLLSLNDPKLIWQAIDWKGGIQSLKSEQPTDEDFVSYFEKLLHNPDHPDISQEIHNSDNTDFIEEFPTDEVQTTIEQLNNSYGLDGLATKVFSCMPFEWILFITNIFNFLFNSSSFPYNWRFNKLVIIYKRGLKELCKNYRGISVMCSMAKIYDALLLNRLKAWFTLSREQAGAQRTRGCLELIMSLRFIIAYAMKKKSKLYILFVDYSAAYDRVPRNRLINVLAEYGCPDLLLGAIKSIYDKSYLILSGISFRSNSGVYQGAPSSGFLFCIYLEKFVRKLRNFCPHNGFLKWLNCMLLMDDKVIFATSLDDLQAKIKLLHEFCIESGMLVNLDKTKIMIINKTDDDSNHIFQIGNDIIKTCTNYCYLGCYFTDDGKINSSIALQADNRAKDVNKFSIFLGKNSDFPFHIKLKVFDACILSSILYGCESWLCEDLASVNTIYMRAIKLLLGVRASTPNNTCLIELGYPTLKEIVRKRQRTFYTNYIQSRQNINHDPLFFTFELVKNSYPSIVKHLTTNLNIQNLEYIKNQVRISNKTKSMSYLSLNPNLLTHEIYHTNHFIPEFQRKVFTRLRLSSHNLKIETGRWRIPPIPIDQRLCQCGAAPQSESHIIESCILSHHIRINNPNVTFSIPNIFYNGDSYTICSILYTIYNIYT